MSRSPEEALTTGGGGENPEAVVEILMDDSSTDIATLRVV